MGILRNKRTIVMVLIIIVMIVVSALAFVYLGGLAFITHQRDATYKVTIGDDYNSLDGITLKLKVFDNLVDGHEIVDVSSGVGYITNDYGTSMKVIGIVNNVEDDGYFTMTIGEWMPISACGLIFNVLIEAM